MFSIKSDRGTNLAMHVFSLFSSFWKQSQRADLSGTLNSITSIKAWLNQLGPVNHKLFISWDGRRSLVPRSAGLPMLGTWHHFTDGIVEWVLATLFATNSCYKHGLLANQPNFIVEPGHATVFWIVKLISFRAICKMSASKKIIQSRGAENV